MPHNKCQMHSARPKVPSIKKWLANLSEEDLIHHMTFAFCANKNGASNEYELLVEMLRLQSPPPTPIHPRAVGIQFASRGSVNDGRNEMQRVMTNRFVRPRLFQLIEKHDPHYSEVVNGLSSLPPEISSLLRKDMKIEKNRSKLKNDSSSQSYDVMARKFEAPWGQVLSLGPTNEMRKADEMIMMCTYIQSGCRHIYYNGNDRAIYCTFRKGGASREFEGSCLDMNIIRLLHIVSRGRAFSEAPKKTKSIVFASWFSPTTDWFSLPMYLASRFEVALWKSFENQISGSSSYLEKKIMERKTVIEDSFSRLSPLQTTNMISCAISRAMQKVLSSEFHPDQLRDMFFPRLFQDALNIDSSFRVNVNWNQPHLIPLTLVSTIIDKFRIKVIYEFELCISRMIELDLSRIDVIDTLPSLKHSSRKKRKKKNKRRPCTKTRVSKLVPIDEQKAEKAIINSQGSDLHLPLAREAFDEKKNQITVFILGIINDIFDNVFYEVGIIPSYKDSDDGFVITDDKPKIKSRGNRMDTAFILRRTPKSTRAIAKPNETQYLSTNVNEPIDTYFGNQLTMKINNTSASNSIWYTQPHVSSHSPFSASTSGYHNFLDLFTQSNNNDHLSGYLDHGADPHNLHYNENLFYGRNEDKGYGLFDGFFQDTIDSHDDNFASSTAASLASSILDNDESVSLDESPDEREYQPVACSFNNTEDFVQNNIHGCGENMEKFQSELESNAIKDGKKETDTGDTWNRIDEDLDAEDPSLVDEQRINLSQGSQQFLSLADIGELRRRASLQNNIDDVQDTNGGPCMSSLSGPRIMSSREDTEVSVDDNTLGQKIVPLCSSRTVDFSILSYKNAAMKLPRKARSVSSHDFMKSIKHLRPIPVNSSIRSFPIDVKGVIVDDGNFDVCARSESALNDYDNSSHWNVMPKSVTNNNDNLTSTRDGATTISSIPTPHDIDDIVCLKEERDSYRDMCLSMASEISKLKNMLALERINSNYPMPRDANPFGSECVPFFNLGRHQGATRKFVAMSDAGLNNEVPMSEDGCGDLVQTTGPTDYPLQPTSHTNNNGSRLQLQKPADNSENMSLDYDNATQSAPPPSRLIPCYKYSGTTHLHSLQSRLSHEIECFVVANSEELEMFEKKRKIATERLTKLVTAIWPRAQVKAYGSQETGLRLPSSDLDFVISLPEVHRKAPADAPGDLEGRNAINETSQKLLARKLKSESWIEPRTIKIIEHTLIPIIKFSTKDIKSKSLQLDISFDSKGHQGIESVHYVKRTIENYPVIRPIVLVLKQFLLDKGLLTAYTGGLSSHCLFLMVNRYLQEQNLAWVDVGALLMGFLDFYGNIFDPRIHGISVVDNGQYFHRPHYQQTDSQPQQCNGIQRNDLSRSKSFHDKNCPTAPSNTSTFGFDPLYVEDPISLGNNVGRNSFRINQVQRALSDAHRALVASLEWDMNCGSESQERYSLLKCLIHT